MCVSVCERERTPSFSKLNLASYREMDVILSLSSSVSISKPFNQHFLIKHQRRPRMLQFSVSCRATSTKVQVADETTNNNLYQILCLSPNSAITMDEIKRAYRSMALRYHPDVCKKEESTRMFVQLNAAYKTLSNPRLRAEYDYELGLRTASDIDKSWRSRWQEQVVELKRRSHRRMTQKEGSWGSRMRAQNMKDYHN